MNQLSKKTYEALRPLAIRYVWWKSADEALSVPEHALAHIMNLATFEDMQALIQATGEESLKTVLSESLPGWFSGKSWHYWHYRLALSELGNVPNLPIRKFS